MTTPSIEQLWGGKPWAIWNVVRRGGSRTFLIANRRVQHPVGQGFFHTGLLSLADGSGAETGLLYVYDCGSTGTYKSARAAAINHHLAETKRSKIDLLFVSHVHFDHVSGLEQLLDKAKGAKAGTIILPLIDPIHRLVVYARALAEDPAVATPFYRDFIIDPVAALASRFGPDRIMLVTRGEDRPDDAAEDLLPRPGGTPPDMEKSALKIVGHGQVNDVTDQFGSTPGLGQTRIYSLPDTLGFSAAAFMTVSGQGQARTRAWYFRTYVDPDVVRGRATFLRELRNRLGLSARQLKASMTNAAWLRDLVTHKRLELVKAYESVTTDLNTTSLSVYAGPMEYVIGDEWCAGRDDALQLGLTPVRTGWLGTGDAQLRKTASRRGFLKHFANSLKFVSTLTLPHHGSEDNFHVDLLKRVAPRLCIASADTQFKWRHPATRVMQDVSSSKTNVQVVTAQSSPLVEDVFLV